MKIILLTFNYKVEISELTNDNNNNNNENGSLLFIFELRVIAESFLIRVFLFNLSYSAEHFQYNGVL